MNMNTLEIKGVLYKKSALIARQFGYTTDYVGQLCRSGKVAAQMVGRSWYVDPASVEEYREHRYEEDDTKLPQSTPTTGTIQKNAHESPDRFLHMRRRQGYILPQYVRELSYEKDDADLLPKVQKSFSDTTQTSTRVAITKLETTVAEPARNKVFASKDTTPSRQAADLEREVGDLAAVVAARPFGKAKKQEIVAFIHKNKLVTPEQVAKKPANGTTPTSHLSAQKQPVHSLNPPKDRNKCTQQSVRSSAVRNVVLAVLLLLALVLIAVISVAVEIKLSYENGLPFMEKRFVLRLENLQEFFAALIHSLRS